MVRKGETELLPIKFDIQFVTTIQTLIEVIKCGALLSIEVFHSTSRAGDHIVGRAHVPLNPLLSETWVQGKAPVWANIQDGVHLRPHLLVIHSPSFCIAHEEVVFCNILLKHGVHVATHFGVSNEEAQVAMLGIRISLEDVTASHGLLPEGKGPPPPIPITQPDAQVPPPPPKVPSVLPSTPVAVSHSPQPAGSPSNSHDSRMDAGLEALSPQEQSLVQPPSPQLTSVSNVQQVNIQRSEPAVLSDGSVQDNGRQVMRSPTPTQSPIPSPTPSSTPETAVQEALTGIDLVPRPPLQIKPYCPKDSGSPSSGPTQLPSEIQSELQAGSIPAVSSSVQALANSEECNSPDRHADGAQEAYGEGVSSPVHYLAANASPLPPSPMNYEASSSETSRAAAASPSVVSATNSVLLSEQPTQIPKPQLSRSSMSQSTSMLIQQGQPSAPSTQPPPSLSPHSLDAASLQPPQQLDLSNTSQQVGSSVQQFAHPRSVPPGAVEPLNAPGDDQVDVSQSNDPSTHLRSSTGAHTPQAHASSPHTGEMNISPHALSATEPSASMMATTLEQPRLDLTPPDTNGGESNGAHSEYKHPAAVPENAHMRPDMAHSHLRPPVPKQHDQRLLELAGQPSAAHAGSLQTPPPAGHDAVNYRFSPQHTGLQGLQSVSSPGAAPQVHVSSSPSGAVTHSQHQQQQHHSQFHGSQAETPNMNGWHHSYSGHEDPSILRSAEVQAQLERARIVAAERAALVEARSQQIAAFEDWKRREKFTWVRDVVHSETEQMAVLEAAWAEREATRQRDIGDAVARVEALKTQLLKKAEELEQREARLFAAEEATLRHKDDLEAAGAARANEAQAAIARLQAEFSHQLAVEAARGSELAIQRANAQQELESAQADAKKKRAQLAAAQAETPQVAVEALHVEIASARRRAADAERTRCEAEAMSAEYTQQLEILARQLEEARQMQRRARDAAEQATLATPPPPPPPQAPEHSSPSPSPQHIDRSPACGHSTCAHTQSQNQHLQKSPSPEPQPAISSIAQGTDATGPALSRAAPGPISQPRQKAVTPEASNHSGLAAESPESWSDPIIIPPPTIRGETSTCGVVQDQRAPVVVPAPSHRTSTLRGTHELPPVVVSPPQENSVKQRHVSPPAKPAHPSLSEAFGSAGTTSCKAGAIQQSIGYAQRSDRKGTQVSPSAAGDNVLVQRVDNGNHLTQCSPTQEKDGTKDMLPEIKRLFHERSKLLATGCYSMNDMVIARISERISSLSAGL